MTETSRLDRIEAILEENGRQIRDNSQQIRENTQDIRGIHAALREINQTMVAFAQAITELRVSAATVIEAQRSTQESVERLSNTVATLATEAAQDRAEIRQIWEYLLRDRGNGQTQ